MEVSTSSHRRTEKTRKARVINPVYITIAVMMGLGIWSAMLWWTFRNME